jgi:hypothetical protein
MKTIFIDFVLIIGTANIQYLKDNIMRTSSRKAKGRKGCQDVKELLHKHAPHLQNDDILVTSSGVPGIDITLSPLAGVTYPINIEVKNQEKIQIWQAIEQCEAHKNPYGRIPALFFRRNRSDLYVTLKAEEFIKLLAKKDKTNG